LWDGGVIGKEDDAVLKPALKNIRKGTLVLVLSRQTGFLEVVSMKSTMRSLLIMIKG
jgi:4-hydroxy-L-threonine phosphate dehydrogenase PdxA